MGNYKIILADPAWSFKVWNKSTGSGRSAESHYRTMTIEDIKSLPVKDIAAKDSVLFLWCVNPSLPDALEVIKSWGFTYKTVAFSWVKETINGKDHVGMGYYTRANCELCLLATRGKTLKRQSKSVRQLVRAKIGRHSEKPREVRERIVQLFGDLPKIELFARERVEGWDALGYDLDGMDIRDSLSHIITWYVGGLVKPVKSEIVKGRANFKGEGLVELKEPLDIVGGNNG